MAYKSTGPIDCSIKLDTSNLKGRTAIVTGGASGIGLAYVRKLIEAGAYVVIADVNEEGGKKVQEEMGKAAVFVKCDVCKWSDQLAVFKQAIELSPEGQIDIVAANAGVASNDLLITQDLSTDEPAEPEFRTLNINLHGVLYTTKLALWYFQKQQAQLGEGKGRDRNLVLQASLAGYLDLPGAQYGASKFGVRGLMRCLRQSVGMHGIRVNLIAPWYINTPIMNEQFVGLVEGASAGWATVEDCALALIRIVSDQKVFGRALAIVPRAWKGAPQGFMDIDQDDFAEGSWMGDTQGLCMAPFASILGHTGQLFPRIHDRVSQINSNIRT